MRTKPPASDAVISALPDMLEILLGGSPLLAAYLDPSFNFIWVNRAYAQADGREPSFFVGKNHFSLYPDAANMDIFANVLRTGQVYTAQSRPFVYADHPERGTTWWDWNLVPIHRNGAVSGLLFTLTDVTRRHLAEQALQAERDNLEQAVASRTAELEATVLRLSQQMESRRKLEQERVDAIMLQEFISRISGSLASIIPEEIEASLERAIEQIGEFLDVDQVWITEMPSRSGPAARTLRWPAGSPQAEFGLEMLERLPWAGRQITSGQVVAIHALSDVPADSPDHQALLKQGVKSCLLLPLQMGEETRAVLSLTCLRARRYWKLELVDHLQALGRALESAIARRDAQRALRASQRQMQDLLESMAAVPLTYDPQERRFVYVGPQVTEIFGFEPSQWCQPGFWEEHILGEDRAATLQAVESARQNQQDVIVEYRMEAQDGRLAWIHQRFRVDRSEGEGVRMSGVLFEVTARKNAEAQAKQLRNELAHMSRVSIVGEFAASLAHELNQPLAAIHANAQAAQRFLDCPQPDLDEVRLAIRDIISDNHRASTVIRRLRDLLRKGQVERKPLDLNRVIEEVLVLVREELIAKSIRLDFQPADPLPEILADRVQLQQVLLNLVLNGCEAMASCPRPQRLLTIRTGVQKRQVVTAVSDQGPPVPGDLLQKLFQPFFTTKPQGLGMGLPISKTVIEAHGGALWATRNQGHGLTVQFSLPTDPRDPARPSAAS